MHDGMRNRDFEAYDFLLGLEHNKKANPFYSDLFSPFDV